MEIKKNKPSGGREAKIPEPASPGEAEFVVVDRDDLNINTEHAYDDDAADSTIDTPPSPALETTAFATGTFHLVGTYLSESTASAHSSICSTTAPNSTDVAPETSTAAATDTVETVENSTDATADCAIQKSSTGAAIMGAAEAVLNFLYAYAIAVYYEGLGLVEIGWNLAKKPWRRWNERGPVRPRLKYLARGSHIPVMLGLVLTMVAVSISSYLALPSSQDEAGKLSAQEWQAKYEDMLSKHSFDSMRSRMKYDMLAGKHLELQTDFEALQESLRSKPQHNSRSSKVNVESNDGDTVQGPFAVVRDALAVAEKSVYDMYTQFSDALREDMREIAEQKHGGGGGSDGWSWTEEEEALIGVVERWWERKKAEEEEVANSGKNTVETEVKDAASEGRGGNKKEDKDKKNKDKYKKNEDKDKKKEGKDKKKGDKYKKGKIKKSKIKDKKGKGDGSGTEGTKKKRKNNSNGRESDELEKRSVAERHSLEVHPLRFESAGVVVGHSEATPWHAVAESSLTRLNEVNVKGWRGGESKRTKDKEEKKRQKTRQGLQDGGTPEGKGKRYVKREKRMMEEKKRSRRRDG